MHTITPRSNDHFFTLNAEIGKTSSESLASMEIIEGIKHVDAIRKLFFIYGHLTEYTRPLGTNIYSAPEPYSPDVAKVPKPHQYLRANPLPKNEERVVLDVPIAPDTKQVIESAVQKYELDFADLFAGAVGYYGLLAAHIYNGDELYLKNILGHRDRIIIIDN